MRVKKVLICLLALLMLCSIPAMAEEYDLRGYIKGQGWKFVQLGQYPYEKDGTVAPVLWRVLEILREEGASFSLLCEPERGEYESLRSKTLRDKIRNKADGEATCELGALGNVLFDRLGDLWEVKRIQGGKSA